MYDSQTCVIIIAAFSHFVIMFSLSSVSTGQALTGHNVIVIRLKNKTLTVISFDVCYSTLSIIQRPLESVTSIVTELMMFSLLLLKMMMTDDVYE